VKAPGAGDRRTALLQDIAVLTGGKALTAELGNNLSAVDLKDLGAADKVVVSRNNTTIWGGRGAPSEIESHANVLRAEIGRASNPFERERLQERLTNFAGRIATIHVGGSTPPDIEDQTYRAQSAMHAARSSIEEGWVGGGGSALVNARSAVLALSFESEAQQAGADTIAHALERPFRVLVESAKRSPVQVLSERQELGLPTFGFNAESGNLEDLVKAGILDSTKSLRHSLEIGFSYARMILRTDVWSLSEEPPPED
jgi:chaperonin GroEL